MPVLQGELSPLFVKEYWSIVEDLLENVFRVPNSKGLTDLQNEIYQLTAEEQAYFFHAEPLDVAADLAGIWDQDLGRYEAAYDKRRAAHRRVTTP